MPTIVGILTFISRINATSERLRARNFLICKGSGLCADSSEPSLLDDALCCNTISYPYQVEQFISVLRAVGGIFRVYTNFDKQIVHEDPGQTPHFAASDLGVHCLPIFQKKDARLIWMSATAIKTKPDGTPHLHASLETGGTPFLMRATTTKTNTGHRTSRRRNIWK